MAKNSEKDVFKIYQKRKMAFLPIRMKIEYCFPAGVILNVSTK